MTERPFRIAFFGTPDFASVTLQALCENPDTKPLVVVTQPDRPAGRGGRLKPSSVKELALANDIPVLQPEKIRKNESFMSELKEFAPFDLAVLVAFGQIIPNELLTLPKAGFVNIHASLLPRWRGAAPMQRAILALDKETGISLMRLEAGLDTGGVYTKEAIPITLEDNLETIHDKLAQAGAKSLIANLDDIISGKLPATEQEATGITYAEKIENDEAEIDWSKPAKNIHAQIRAFSPFPGAYTFLTGKRLKIYKAEIKPAATQKKQNGEINFCDNKSILEVQCGDGILALQEVQLEGKRRMTTSEFLKGAHITAGMLLSK